MPYKDPADRRAAWQRMYDGRPEFRADALARKALLRQRNAAYVREAKARPCADCGQRYPYYVMDFDHLEDKEGQIGQLVHRPVSLATLQREMDKCEVVCSNCHRERTQRRIRELVV